jgi:hypothetical protein
MSKYSFSIYKIKLWRIYNVLIMNLINKGKMAQTFSKHLKNNAAKTASYSRKS